MFFKSLVALASVPLLGSRQDPSLQTMTSPLPIAYPQGSTRESPRYGHVQSGFHRSQDSKFQSMPPKATDMTHGSKVVINAERFLEIQPPIPLIRIDASKLKDFPEEKIDPNEVEGLYIFQDRTLFIKDTYLSSMCNAKILKIVAETFQKQSRPLNSGLIAPEQTPVIDQSTKQVLVATDAIAAFRSFKFDYYEILKSIYTDHEDIASMILTSYALVPNLHNRDLGVCERHKLCVTDLDSLDFSVINLESARLALSEFENLSNIPILNNDSIELTHRVLKELNDKLSKDVFHSVSELDRATLLKHKNEIINCIENGTNKKIHGKFLINPKKSFDSLLKKLETKTVPELLLEALKTRIDVTLDALEKTKAYLEANPQSDQKTLILKFFQAIKKKRLAYSTKQHNIPAKTRKKLQASYKAALNENPILPLDSTVSGEFDAFVDRADPSYALHEAIRFIGSHLQLKSLENPEL